MTAALLALLMVATSPADRLAAFIVKRNATARPYAGELARRIMVEAKRHGLQAHELAAVAWIESDFRRGLRGRAYEIGIWQLRPFDHGMGIGWQFLKSRPAEFPIVRNLHSDQDKARRLFDLPWRSLRWKYRRKVLDDVRAGTYLGAYSIRRHVQMCRRLGHRVGRWRCSKTFINKCPQVHRHEIDRLGHYNSGVGWPKAAYLRKLRWRSRAIGRAINGH